jgi:hypothetical protein
MPALHRHITASCLLHAVTCCGTANDPVTACTPFSPAHPTCPVDPPPRPVPPARCCWAQPPPGAAGQQGLGSPAPPSPAAPAAGRAAPLGGRTALWPAGHAGRRAAPVGTGQRTPGGSGGAGGQRENGVLLSVRLPVEEEGEYGCNSMCTVACEAGPCDCLLFLPTASALHSL